MAQRTQTINGTEYVYEEIDTHWVADKKYGTRKRKYIGKMVDGLFVPNKNYLLQKALDAGKHTDQERSKLSAFRRSFCGATWLFEQIGCTLGITDDLKVCFPDTWKQILSIAYYLILEDRNPLSRFPRWASNHRHPFAANIPSQRSSELFGMITEEAKRNFFILQAKRRMETEYLAYDTTSISSYSNLIQQVRYGRNKDHDPLPQINLALLYGETSRLPAYYRKLPGNISDVATIRQLLADIDYMALEKVKLVMDRGFYSEDNINSLYHNHLKFLIGVKVSLKFVQEVLDDVRDSMRSRSSYSSSHKLHYHSRTIDWHYQEKKKRSGTVIKAERRMYLHLFYNDQKAVDDKAAFNALLDSLETELRTSRRVAEHEKLYDKYFSVTRTPVRGISVEPKEEAIALAEKDYGFFALISNDLKDPLVALDTYRSKDVIEKAFGNLKERLNMRRTSVSSEQNLEGKLFVQFLALMHLAYIDKKMNDTQLYKYYTMHELLDEFDGIECFEEPGKRLRIGEMTKKQIGLYQKLEVEAPA